MKPLTKSMLNRLRSIAGDKSAPKPRNRWAAELSTRALIDRELISTDGWNLTKAGLEALAQNTD